MNLFYDVFSDDERREMESLGCQNVIWKNLMFFPVLGPSVRLADCIVIT